MAVYRQQAAANAARRSGHHEVIRTLTRACVLLTQWPDTRERAHQELALLTALGPTLMATRGVAAPEVEQTYVRMQALAHHAQAFLYAADPGVILLCYAARALWLLGYPAQAVERSHAALTLAEQLSHPFSQAYAVTWTAFLQQLRRDRPAVDARVEEVRRRATAQGFPFLAEAGAF